MPVAAVLWELWQLTHAWEQRKFKNIFKKSNIKNDLSYSKNQVISVATMTWKEAPKSSTDDYMKTYNVIQMGDIAFEGHKNKNYMFGRFVENTLGNGIVSHIFDVYSPLHSKHHDLLFWKYYINSEKVMRNILRKATTNARMMHNLITADLNKQIICVPSYKEEIKIGLLLDTIENIITLQQRKLDLLKALRKAFLQELFANKNDQQPKLRFAGFDSDWETRRASNIFTERKEKSDEKQLLSVSINGGITPFDESKRKNNSSKDKHNYRLVLPGDIAYNSMRMWQGALGVSSLEGIVSPAYTVIIPRKGEDADFYYYMFKRTDSLHVFQRHSQGLTSDTWNLKFPLFKSINFSTTTTQEQGKIANILLCLDRNISHQQDKLDESTSLKKSLLQKMFI